MRVWAGLETTVSVTGTCRALPVESAGLSVILPENTPGFKPVGSTDTFSSAGALVSEGLTASHVRPVPSDTAAVAKKRAFVADRAVTVSVFVAGRGPPTRNVNDSLSSDNTSVTGSTASPAASLAVLFGEAEPPDGETVIKPLYVPG